MSQVVEDGLKVLWAAVDQVRSALVPLVPPHVWKDSSQSKRKIPPPKRGNVPSERLLGNSPISRNMLASMLSGSLLTSVLLNTATGAGGSALLRAKPGDAQQQIPGGGEGTASDVQGQPVRV